MLKFVVNKKRSSIFLVIFLLCGIFSCLNPQLAQAATTYYVSPQGNDSNTGSQSAPFKTLQKGVNSVSAGDKLIVKDGTYTSAEVSKAGTAGAWITIQSENKYGAKIVTPQAYQQGASLWGFYFYPSAAYVTVLDFDISGGTAGVSFDGAAGNIIVKGNKIHDVGRFCSDITNGFVGMYLTKTKNITIEGNTFQNMGRFGPGENGCQPGNEYYQNHDHGVYINGSSAVLVKNNVFIDFNHGWPVQVYSGEGSTSSNLKIYNNTFAFDNPYKSGHIILSGSINGMEIKNNIFYQPRNSAIDFYLPNVTNVTVSNNLVYGVPMNTITVSGMTYTNNKENANPLFVNPTGFDFNLQATSPALNTGLTLSDVATDFKGTVRPQGSGYDLGAFESAGATVCPTDINLDGTTNVLDFSILQRYFFQPFADQPRVDINKDGTVNVLDFSLLSANFFKPC